VLQVVDLQRSAEFQDLDVTLLSIAPDPTDAWKSDEERYGIVDYSTVLSDIENEVAKRYDVLKWAAATGEPGHTFILIDESGTVSWIRDYGAPQNGGIMYVTPDEITELVAEQLDR
jgi:alkyl hydroperoxide reductase subunit AhpC